MQELLKSLDELKLHLDEFYREEGEGRQLAILQKGMPHPDGVPVDQLIREIDEMAAWLDYTIRVAED